MRLPALLMIKRVRHPDGMLFPSTKVFSDDQKNNYFKKKLLGEKCSAAGNMHAVSAHFLQPGEPSGSLD
jgi:hypothetical protein